MTAPKQEQTEQGGLQGTRRLLASVRGLLEVSSKVGVILRILRLGIVLILRHTIDYRLNSVLLSGHRQARAQDLPLEPESQAQGPRRRGGGRALTSSNQL